MEGAADLRSRPRVSSGSSHERRHFSVSGLQNSGTATISQIEPLIWGSKREEEPCHSPGAVSTANSWRTLSRRTSAEGCAQLGR
jgi:hypothetical protein